MKKNYFDNNNKFTLKLFYLFLAILFVNVMNAQQCNASSGTVFSNTDVMCVGSNLEFWSNGWAAGGTWSSSNPSILTINFITGNSGNGRATAIAAGTADVIYTVKQAGCPDKISKKTITVGSAVGAVSANQTICTGSSLTSNITIASTTGTIQWKRADDAAFTTNVINVGTNSTTLTIAQVGVLTATKYFRAVMSGGTCGTGTSAIVTVTVSPATVAGTLTLTDGNAKACSSGNYTAFRLTGYTGSIIRWESSTDNFATAGTPIANLNNSYGVNNLTLDTSFRAVVQSGGCSVAYSNSIKVTIYGAMPATGAISLNGILYPHNGATNYCPNTTVVFSIDPVANASNYTWVIPTGWSVISGQGTTSLTAVTGNASESANIEVYATNLGCQQANQSYLYLYLGNPLPSTPTLSVPIQPTCAVPTGSFTITNYDSSYTYSASPSVGVVITGNTVTAPSGIYTITATSGSCTSVASANVTITGPALVTWNGTNWSPANTPPTINNRVEFTGGIYNSTTNIDACSCYVKNNALVTFNSGHTLNVINEVKVESGSLIFENNASLVQVNEDPTINSGNINYHRHTAAVKRYDYTYWSSPVQGQIMYNLSPNTFYDKYYSYNDKWEVNKNGTLTMLKGEGYIIRAPQNHDIHKAIVDKTPVFKGVPNNGKIEKSLTGAKLYLLGNPYPSALDADAFLKKNEDVLEGTLYFWTHNTAIQLASNITNGTAGSGAYAYTSADYATYNRTGGVGTARATITIDGATSTTGAVLTGKIAAGQGFFAPASTRGGTLEFNNTMRVVGGAEGKNNSQFFKLTTGKTTTTVAKTEKSRIWLNLTNKEGAFKQALIGYISGATNDYDGAFDGVSYDGNTFVDFYSVSNDKNLTIQGRALPFVKKDSVALGYKSTIKGEFQISIDQADGVLAAQNVFLEDKDLKIVHDLKKEAYTFSTEKGTFNSRFVLRYADKNAVDEVIVPEVPGQESNAVVMVSVKDGEIKINATTTKLDKVFVYDMAGRKLFQKNNVDANVFFISRLVWNHQALVVDIVLTDGTKHSRKIIN